MLSHQTNDTADAYPGTRRRIWWRPRIALVVAGMLLVAVLLVVLRTFPMAWATDLLASNGQRGMMQHGMRGGRHMGPGMMTGERMCPMGGQMPSLPFPSSQLPEADSTGAALFQTYCTQCHALPSPMSHTPAYWEQAFNRMFVRMRMMAQQKHSPWGRWMPDVTAPSDEEARTLLAYLKRHGLRPAPEDVAPASAGPGAALFRSTCVRCHALPDPAQHTPHEWPAVVKRMRGNMARMNVPGIDEQTAEQITAFLAQAAGDSEP